MALQVVQWSVGGVGRCSLRALLQSDDFELVGVYTHDPARAGRDAAELASVAGRCGVRATSDVDALLALRADCAVYTAVGETRPREAVGEIAALLGSGANVVSSSMMNLIHPRSAHPSVIESLADACAAGHATLFTSGIDPGWSGDALPLAAFQICERVDRIRVQEIADYGTHADPSWAAAYGFGRPEGAPAPILEPGVPTLFWGGIVRMLAEMLDVELDGLEEFCERWYAPEAVAVRIGRIERGTLAATRFGVAGIVGGEPRLFAEHVTRMHRDAAPEWPQPPTGSGSVHRVDIEGSRPVFPSRRTHSCVRLDGRMRGLVDDLVPSPSLTLDLCMRGADSQHTNAGLVATAMRLVNAIPAVVAAPPGIVTPLDLHLGVGRHLLSRG